MVYLERVPCNLDLFYQNGRRNYYTKTSHKYRKYDISYVGGNGVISQTALLNAFKP